MRFDILSIFPAMFTAALQEGVLGRAAKKGVIQARVTNIRDFATDRHMTTDDRPYGGGEGMVMKPEPIQRALGSIGKKNGEGLVILLTPQGEIFNQSMARELAGWDWLILICGRYEGVDERIRLLYIDREVSIGDYVLSGGEPAALVVMDAVARLVPGVLGGEMSSVEESFEDGLLEHPQYTRPSVFQGLEVPDILLSGDHERIRLWRRRESLKRTLERRPDLLEKAPITEEDKAILSSLKGQA